MTRLKALIGLNIIDIGSRKLSKLSKHFGAPEEILKVAKAKLMSVEGISEETAGKIIGLKESSIDNELALAEKLGLSIITQGDEDYPENLKNIYDPPIVLYVKGSLSKDDNFAIGIVGSRRASFYGLSCAEKFAVGLSGYGVTIISGMARGIDTCAHKGALKSEARTIAVMGSGFNHIYPEENKDLAEEIAANGAVISELPINTRPLPQNFPRRNRVISGLSLGVLVVEAAQNSGALITADFALEQGREVFCLPGKIDSATSFGTNGLIKQGAKLVSCAEEILEELPLAVAAKNFVNQPAQKSPALKTGALDTQEQRLYELLEPGPLILDEIAEKTKLDIPRISGILLKLQLKRMIRQLPSQEFERERG